MVFNATCNNISDFSYIVAVSIIISPANKVWGGGVYRNRPVRPSMYLVSATPPKRLIGFL